MESIRNAKSDDEYLSAWKVANAARVGKPQVLEVRGVRIHIPGDPEVFSPHPDMTHSSEMILNLAGEFNGKSIMDLGCGTGVLSVIAAKEGAESVLACDIHEPSLEATRYNARQNGVVDAMHAMKSDMFGSIPEDRKFDLILANLPIADVFGHIDVHPDTVASQFFQKSRSFLGSGGRMLFASASFGNLPATRTLVERTYPGYREHQAIKFGVTWSVFEARL